MENLNERKPIDKDNDFIHDYNYNFSNGHVTVLFRKLEENLINLINQHECVLGCVAWLTNEAILQAMANCKAVCIIVQKEDFLRPDISSNKNWTKRLRNLYENLPEPIYKNDYNGIGGIINNLNVLNLSVNFEAVRCVGNHNSEKNPAFPRMHNKFLIFCDIKNVFDSNGDVVSKRIIPKKIWTGSFNLTYNSTFSLENAVVISSRKIANAYFNEWAFIVSLSEQLDWKKPWIQPQFAIGT